VAPSLKLPIVIGRYLLEGQVASGGMATVYHGRVLGEDRFARPVAIKRMHPHCARDADFVAMFLDEANLAARIRHPNVVPVLDFASVGEDLIIVMEYVPGDTVGSLIQAAHEAKLYPPHRVVASIIAGVLQGLHAAHEVLGDDGQPLNIVHRDVSPQNIMVGFDGIARVLDFGVAKAAVRFQTTRAGQLKGRLQYMAPEQIRSRPVDRRADLYSASVLYWEMIAGRRLFDSDNAGSTMMMVLEGTVPSLRAVDPSVSPALEWLILKGLRANPADRFNTALEMVNAIEEAVGIASAEEVADWVRQVVPNATSQRVARITGADMDAFAPPPPPPPPPEPMADPPRTQDAPPSMATEDAGRPKSKKLLLTAFGVTLVLCIVAFWFALHHVPWLGPALISTSRAVFGNRITAWIERVAHTADAGWSDLQDSDERPVSYWNLPSASAPSSASSVPPARFRPVDMQPMISAPFARGDGSWMPTDTSSGAQSPCAYRSVLHLDVDHSDRIARIVVVDRRRTTLSFSPGQREAMDDGRGASSGMVAPELADKLLLMVRLPSAPDPAGSGFDGVELSPAAPNYCAVASLRDGAIRIDDWSRLGVESEKMVWWRQMPFCLVQSGADAPSLNTRPRDRSVALGVGADASVLYLAVGEKVASDALARVMRYAGVRHAVQVDGAGGEVTVHLRGGASGFEALSPGDAADDGSGVGTPREGDFFFVVRTDS